MQCKSQPALTDIGQSLSNTSARLAAGEPIKIVAIGSSSTAGAGASSPDASYPSRLQVELSAQYPDAQITVINRGINGQESGDMLARLKSDVIAERPSLVIWQLGTNSVLRDNSVGVAATNIEAGVAQIREIGADVILVDPQFVPRVIAKPEAEDMVKLISATAKQLRIGLFHRFEVMRHWHEAQAIPFEAFTSPDGLHQNDWGYSCWAKLMSASIVQAISRPTQSAGIAPKARPAFIKPPVD
ncbi:MAG: SGNH/GDSL hydrolase family protein [Xanthobacteraceae bacterium]